MRNVFIAKTGAAIAIAGIVLISSPHIGHAAIKQLTAHERAAIETQINTLRTLVIELQAQLTKLQTAAAPQPATIQPRTINPQSIVGLVCYTTESYTDPQSGRTEKSVHILDKGSGVIISPNGEIATSLHLTETNNTILPFSFPGGSIGVLVHEDFAYCDVGQIPPDAKLPTIGEIQSINPITRIPTLNYRAELSLKPDTFNNKSNLESDYSDFAILKITSVTPAGMAAGIANRPSTFPYTDLISAKSVPNGASVVTYGFPGDITAAQAGSFETLYFSGSVGTVTGVAYGTQYYANQPIYVSTDMEIQLGRSGSPLFWNGYVIGIVRGFEPGNRTKSYSVASDIIIKERSTP